MAQSIKSALLKRGNPLLNQACHHRINTFPLPKEVDEVIETCQEALRNVTGFWKDKSMSVAAT